MATTATAPAAAPAAPDLKKRLKPLFNPPREPVLVDVPELGYLMIDGKGAPEETADAPTTEFQQTFQVLFPVVYTIKFRLKRDGLVMPLMPLDALWFTGPDEGFDMNVPPGQWGWRVLMIVSDDVTPAIFDEAVEEVRRKKGDLDMLGRLRFERWREGRSAQVMHIGPYSEERPTIERLHAFIAEQGLRQHGAHHEIYLGDPRRGDPAKLKTVLRQPVE
ncbi:MAG: GyrI-like domain-containing protein [Candidatus Limnocylindrales bacterium]|jgi:hypothetical protein